MDATPEHLNLPECNSEIAAVFKGHIPQFDVDLVIYTTATNRNTEIKRLNKWADKIVDLLLFPHAETGYTTTLMPTNETNTIIMWQYYACTIAFRPGFSNLHNL